MAERATVIERIEQALEAQDFDVASALAGELVATDGTDAEALALEAWAEVRAGDVPEDALRAVLGKLDRAVSTNRTNDRAVYYRGLAYKRLGNVPAAFRDFARAMQLNPGHAGAEREVRLFAARVRKVTE